MLRRRVLLYAGLALAVPLPAFALDAGSGPASLSVQASLAQCGIASSSVVCEVSTTFNRLPEADYYTASVTAPNGNVQDFGTVAEGGGAGRASAGLWVAYAGSGDYTVTVSAWGQPDRGQPQVIEVDEVETNADPERRPGEADVREADERPTARDETPDEKAVSPGGEGTQDADRTAPDTPEAPDCDPEASPVAIDSGEASAAEGEAGGAAAEIGSAVEESAPSEASAGCDPALAEPDFSPCCPSAG
jgi:hypothetical protein